MPQPLTLWQQFKQDYAAGCGSFHCSSAHRVVLAKGAIPCDILIVGEAPGESEDSIGQPFVGISGHLLDYITGHSIPKEIPEWRLATPASTYTSISPIAPTPSFSQRKVRVGYTNLVGCIPREGNTKAGAPDVEQIECCSRRLTEFIILCNPALIICVGTLARDYLDRKHLRAAKLYWRHIDSVLHRPIALCSILHPAWILRQNNALQSLWKRRCIIAISEACEECFSNKVAQPDEEIPF